MIEINNRTKSKIDLKAVREVSEKFARVHKQSGKDISIAFIGDSVMRNLNKIYRGKDKPTDILTFEGDEGYLGEIIIDYAQIKRQSGKWSGGSVKKELIFILVHGLFHLLGHEDDTEIKRLKMIKMGEEFIKNYKS